MDGLSKCILSCLRQLGTARTISATFYILKGKKSSQTIQDIHLFKVSPFFCVFPDLDRRVYDSYLNELSKKQLIYFVDENNVCLTEKGENLLQELRIPKVNGFKYGKSTQIFWKRFVLIVQTISNLANNNNKFRPVMNDDEIQLFVKKYLLSIPTSKKQFNDSLYTECLMFLRSMERIECEIFVRKLTGMYKIGLTNRQIAHELSIHEWDVYLIFQSMMHDLLSRIEDFPLLYSICPMLEVKVIGNSAIKTKKLLEMNKTIEEISTIRHLKRSTVEDHIIEIVRNDDSFRVEQFTSVEKQKKIVEVYEQSQTKKLSELKQLLDDTISYFDIRLVLVRMWKND